MNKRIPVIVQDECIACGPCEEICPGAFQVNRALGFAVVVNPEGCDEEGIQEAIDTCPTHCIHWSDEME